MKINKRGLQGVYLILMVFGIALLFALSINVLEENSEKKDMVYSFNKEAQSYPDGSLEREYLQHYSNVLNGNGGKIDENELPILESPSLVNLYFSMCKAIDTYCTDYCTKNYPGWGNDKCKEKCPVAVKEKLQSSIECKTK